MSHQQTYRERTVRHVIEIDSRTWDVLTMSAKVISAVGPAVTPGEVVARLVEQAFREEPASEQPPNESEPPDDTQEVDGPVHVHFVYNGERVEGLFDRSTRRIGLIAGPLSGRSFDTPSQAATEVVRAINPETSPERNGWKTWRVTDTGERLESIRT